MGKSGCGKTTLLNIIGLLENEYTGDYYFNDVTISQLSENKKTLYRKNYIGYVFQDFQLIESLSVYDNIIISLELLNKEKDTTLVSNMLTKVGLSGYENKKINTKCISIENSDKKEYDIKDNIELIYNHNSLFGFSHSEPNPNELKINSEIISSTSPSSDYITLERMCDDDKGNIRSDGFPRLKMKMPPSVNSKVLNIEYYIKATVYFKQFVGYNSRPRAYLYFSLVD